MSKNINLSIIIPCYNCERTLEEAVLSCFNQGLKQDDFEIVMVDDKSTDNTVSIMKNLCGKYSNISAYYHEINKGGGATRNTAVSKTKADIIFCLDSDDMLAPDTLNRMLKKIQEENLDGVTFSGSFTFKNKIENSHINEYGPDGDQFINLKSLFNGEPWPLGGNFMYTKKAFLICNGYPVSHSLDTQGYGFRFASNKLKAKACKKAYFFQRQYTKNESYFERTFKSGLFSASYYIIVREKLSIFNDKIKKEILNYDIFNKNTPNENILKFLIDEYKKEKDNFFSSSENGSEIESAEQSYVKEDYKLAITTHIKCENYDNNLFDLLRYHYGLKNNKIINIDKYNDYLLENMIQTHKINYFRMSLPHRFMRKIKKILKK